MARRLQAAPGCIMPQALLASDIEVVAPPEDEAADPLANDDIRLEWPLATANRRSLTFGLGVRQLCRTRRRPSEPEVGRIKLKRDFRHVAIHKLGLSQRSAQRPDD